MKNTPTPMGATEHILKQWGAMLDDLALRATTAGAQAQAAERRLIADLNAEDALAQATLAALKAAGPR